MNYIHEKISYDEMRLIDSNQLKLVSDTLPSSGEHITRKTDDEIKKDHTYESKTSTRNIGGSYIINTESDSVLLNIIPKKRFITDNSISYIINNVFSFFEEPLISLDLPELFVLPEGTIFRLASEGSLDKEFQSFYMIEDGSIKKLPNYKTVEVMLFERGRTIDEIRIIENSEYEDLLAGTIRNNYIRSGMSQQDADEALAKYIMSL